MENEKNIIISIYLVMSLFMTGFIGFLVFEDILCESNVKAENIYVDINGNGDYTSIQAAIDMAGSGSTIYIWAGTYYENIIVNKTLTIIGNGTDNTIINGSLKDTVIYVSSNYVNISGITVTGSNQSWTDLYAGIKLDNVNNATIINTNCSGNLVGIHLNNSHLNTFKNNSCSNIWSGIYCFLSNLNLFENNTCDLNDQYGIGLYFSNSNLIKYNSFDSNGQTDIEISYSDLNTISNNNLINSIMGIAIYSSKSNTVTNNEISSTLWGIQLDESEGITIKNNEMDFSGIYLSGAQLKYWDSHDIDTSNTVNDKAVYYWKNKPSGKIPLGAGQVILVNCQNVIIENQNFNHVNYGVQIAYSNDNTIKNNAFSLTLFGIYLFNSNSNLIINNICTNSSEGFHFTNSNSNTIMNNTYSNNWYGMSFYDSDSNTITYSNFSDNDNGISLEDTASNIINNNIITFNTHQGLALIYSDNNIIYHNNFIDNDIQALYIGLGTNQWDNGHSEGNYWSDYTGLDNGGDNRVSGDGVGDTKLSHLALDYYPFMNLSGWLYPGIPYIYDPGEFDCDGNYLLSWRKAARTTYYDLLEAKDYSFATSVISYSCSNTVLKIEGKQNGTYYYRLRAYNDAYVSNWSTIVDMEVDFPPNTPKYLQVSVYSAGNALNLTWAPNQIDTKRYDIEYKNDNIDDWEHLASLEHPTSCYNHSGLTDEITYYYRLRAWDFRNQTSGFSELVSGIPKDTNSPAPPQGVTTLSTSIDRIELFWETNTEPDIKCYNIYRSTLPNITDWGKPIGSALKGNEKYIDEKDLEELTTYYYVLTAYDEVPNESGYSDLAIGTTTLGQHGPEINYSIANFEIPEDGYDDSSINLNHWFKDINGDVLSFRCEGDVHLEVIVYQENGTVVIHPEPNWNGKETLTFFASDDTDERSDNITITITPVNDPPEHVKIKTPDNGLTVVNDTSITFNAEYNDPGIIYGDLLTCAWFSNISGKLGVGEILSDVKLPVGHHLIILEVSDSYGESSSAMVNISIIEKDKLDKIEPNMDKGEKSDEMSNSNLIVAGVGIIIIIVVVLLVLVWYKMFRKKGKDN